jgi:hypothetical protein
VVPEEMRDISVLPVEYFKLVSCLVYFSALKTEAICSSQTWLTFPGLHGVISQKTKLQFIHDQLQAKEALQFGSDSDV